MHKPTFPSEHRRDLAELYAIHAEGAAGRPRRTRLIRRKSTGWSSASIAARTSSGFEEATKMAPHPETFVNLVNMAGGNAPRARSFESAKESIHD